jgi:excisionase family DNA binding protein
MCGQTMIYKMIAQGRLTKTRIGKATRFEYASIQRLLRHGGDDGN